MKELISKDNNLKAKYGNILSLKQNDIEKYVKSHPKIEDDLANHYVDQIMKHTPARTAADISQAWLYGITGFNRQINAKKNMASPRYSKAQLAYNTAKAEEEPY